MPPTNPATALRCGSRIITQVHHRPAHLASSQYATPLLNPCIRHHSAHSAPHTSTSSTSSVDPTEVSHFNALASSWWDPHGPSRLLHLMNPLRHEFISRCHSSTPYPPSSSKLRYLDIGCGGGIFAESAARLQHVDSVTAIDPTPEVLKVAAAHKRRDPRLMVPGRLNYLNTSIEDLTVPASPEEAYDVVSLFEVLEHVNSPSAFLEHVVQQVKPGGWLVLSTISRTWMSWVVTNVLAEDVLGIVPKGTHEWSKYINDSELKEWFAQRGWGRDGGIKVMGVVYVPGVGWKEVPGVEGWGNYFFGVRRDV